MLNPDKNNVIDRLWQGKYNPAHIVLLAGISLSIFIFILIYIWEDNQINSSFESLVNAQVSGIRHELERHNEGINNTANMFSLNNNVKHHEFAKYIGSHMAAHGDYTGLLWVPLVKETERDNLEKRISALSRNNKSIIEYNNKGKLISATKRGEYYPALFVEPSGGNESIVGYDLGSDPAVKDALYRARDTGKTTSTMDFAFKHRAGDEKVILIIKPVYNNVLTELTTIEMRRRNLRGFIVAGLLVSIFLTESFQEIDTHGIYVQIFEGDYSANMQPLYTHEYSGSSSYMHGDTEKHETNGLYTFNKLNIYDNNWTFRFYSSPSFHTMHSTWKSWSALAAGAMLTIFLVLYISNIHKRTVKIKSLAEELSKTNKALEDKFSENKFFVEALKQNEERFSLVVKGTNDGIWDWDLETGEVFFSSHWKDMLGFSDDEIENNFIAWRDLVHPDDFGYFLNTWVDYMDGEHDSFNIEYRIKTREGDYLWVLCRGLTSTNEEGERTRLSGSQTDISKQKASIEEIRALNEQLETRVEERTRKLTDEIAERKLAEKALSLAKQAAEDANKAKSDFLSSVSHDLRTPLNGILGFGQLLEVEAEGPLNDKQKEYTSLIIESGNYLLTLINDLLNLGRIESGKIELSIQDIEPDKVINESINLVKSMSEERKISLEYSNGEAHIEPLPHIKADHTRLKEILLNLLSNAIKYNVDNGHVKITCHVMDNNMLHIAVSDTGPGIPDEKQSQLFETFNRLGAENSNIEGTGIGLSITKKLVLLMHGDIGYKTTASDYRSVFWFELPLAS